MYDKFNNNYNKMMNAAVIEKYYGYSNFYNVGYWNESTKDQKQASQNLVQKLLSAHSGEKTSLLDVACGKGAACKFINDNKLYIEISGININEQQINFCKTLVPEGDFKVMDACNMTFNENQFDTIISIDAANHFPSRKAFLNKAFEILKPNGTISISDVLFYKPLEKGLKWMNSEKNITVKEYEELFKDAGFKDINIENAFEFTWESYLKYMKNWIEKGFKEGSLNHNEIKAMMGMYKSTKEMPVNHHLIINAKK